MIETPHACDARRQVPVYSLYSETREPTAEMLRGIDVLVVDLQDVGHARLHLHLHDGQLHAGGGPPRRARRRLRPAESNRRRGRRRQPAASRLCVVRRAVSHSAAPRDDDRRAGAAVQRRVRHRRVARRRADRRLAPAMYLDETGMPWIIPSPNLPDARQRDRLPGRGAVRRNTPVGRTWHHEAVRADRRAVDRRRSSGGRDERAGTARRAFPAGVLRADVPETRASRHAAAASCTCSIAADSDRCERRSN